MLCMCNVCGETNTYINTKTNWTEIDDILKWPLMPEMDSGLSSKDWFKMAEKFLSEVVWSVNI